MFSIPRNLAVIFLVPAMMSCPIAVSAATLDPPEMSMDAPISAIGLDDVMAAALAGDPGPARKLLTRLPEDPAAHEFLGIALAKSGDLPGARAAFEEALRLAPGQYTAMTKLGDLALAEQDYRTARDYFDQALKLAPADRLTHQRLGYLDAMDGDDDSAIRHYEAGLKGTAPEYLGVKRDLALLYTRRGDHDRALDLLGPFVEATPPAPGVAAIAAEALTATGKAEEATAVLRHAAKNDFAAAIALAKITASSGDLAAAETTLSAAVAAMPDQPELAFELGALRGLQRNYEGAAAAFDEGLRKAPHNPALLRGAMQAQARLGNMESALEFAQTLAASGDPGDIFLLADIQTRAGQPDAAVGSYRAVLDADGGNIPALNNLSLLLLDRGEIEEAVSLAQRAAKAAPKLAVVQDTLGQVLLRQGDVTAAVAAFERAAELAPDRQDYRDRLEDARKQHGE
ncbi:MAG: tetratricopeptide repeat protein [Pseudorhodobacter sp.]